MRVLLDECLDERFRNSFPRLPNGSLCGLAGLENGELLTAAESAGFDVFLTVDQGIEYQQNLTRRKIAIVILRPKSNRLKDLLSLLPTCLAEIDSVRPGQICKIDA
jgi:hypothetical protein